MNSLTLVILATTLTVLSFEHGEAKPKPFIPFNFWLNLSRQGPVPPPPPAPLVFSSAAFPVYHNVPVVIGPPVYIKTVSTFTKHDDKVNATNSDAGSSEDTTSNSTSGSSPSNTPAAIKGYNVTTNFHTKVIPIPHDTASSSSKDGY